jgi:hypothetical protein
MVPNVDTVKIGLVCYLLTENTSLWSSRTALMSGSVREGKAGTILSLNFIFLEFD